MIHVITAEGTFIIPGTAKDVDTSNNSLKVNRNGQPVAQFRRWIHWFEAPEETTNV